MIGVLLVGAALLGIGAAVFVFWDWIAETISDWIYRSGLSRTLLGRAWVKVEKYGTGLRRVLKAYIEKKVWETKSSWFGMKTEQVQRTKQIQIDTTECEDHELDEDIRERLRYSREVMEYVDY